PPDCPRAPSSRAPRLRSSSCGQAQSRGHRPTWVGGKTQGVIAKVDPRLRFVGQLFFPAPRRFQLNLSCSQNRERIGIIRNREQGKFVTPGRAKTFRHPQTNRSRRVFRSTKTRDKKQALEICRAWHKAERLSRHRDQS